IASASQGWAKAAAGASAEMSAAITCFTRLSVLQPAHIRRRQLYVEGLQRILELADGQRPDDRHDREVLRQAVGKRDVERVLAESLAERNGTGAAGEIPFAVPAVDQLLVVELVRGGAVGEKAA